MNYTLYFCIICNELFFHDERKTHLKNEHGIQTHFLNNLNKIYVKVKTNKSSGIILPAPKPIIYNESTDIC